MARNRSLLGLAVVLVAAGVLWWTQSADPSTTSAPPSSDSPRPAPSGAVSGTSGGAADPASGLPWVDPGGLPPEAREVLALIDRGGPFRYDEDGGTFGNFEGLLPDHERGYYREYTVDTPGSDDRGARRIVTGRAGEYYWTQDHYESFERIAR